MMSVELSVLNVSQLTLMIKPVGPMCNLRCTYCYYLPVLQQHGGRVRRMSLATLESVLGWFLPRAGDVVTIAWQGGEPTLAGLDFFVMRLRYSNATRASISRWPTLCRPMARYCMTIGARFSINTRYWSG